MRIVILLLFSASMAFGQAATITWTNVHQTVDGFGASDFADSGNLTPTQQSFFFGMGNGQLGLSILRVIVTNGSSATGSCTTTGVSCAGAYLSDMQAMVAAGGKVYASSWAPPAAYMSNGSSNCTDGAGSGALVSGDYSSYATWLANFVQSVAAQGVPLYAISIQNEPNVCQSYNSALWTAANIDTFIKTNLGPTFASGSISTLIFMPENSSYSALTGANGGGTCGTDSSCTTYVGGYNWHDYDASLSGTNTVTADPVPTGWASGKRYWETEASCGTGFGPSFCETGFNTDITDALNWAAVIDQRIAVDGANAWLYWRFLEDGDDEGLSSYEGVVAQRAYMLGQYAKFVRPGYVRIDATHNPQTGISVTAYRDTGQSRFVIIATNYTASSVSQTFNLTNVPALSAMTPTTTSATLSLAPQPAITVSGNSFTYTLPADSITTFAANAAPAVGVMLGEM